MKASKSLACAAYLECSARTREGVDEIFSEACRISSEKKKGAKKSKCSIL